MLFNTYLGFPQTFSGKKSLICMQCSIIRVVIEMTNALKLGPEEIFEPAACSLKVALNVNKSHCAPLSFRLDI